MAVQPDTDTQRAKPPTNAHITGDAEAPTTFLEALSEQDPHVPATKQDIANLLRELQQMSAADIDRVRTDVKAVEARTQATENTVLELQREVRDLRDKINILQHSHTSPTQRVDISEYRNRLPNIKVGGVPDSISQAELPHYLRRLVETILTHSQDNKLQLDGCYRINKSRQAPSEATHDIIVGCHSMSDRNQLLAVVKGKTPMDFELSKDLSRNTLQ
ncbi:Hypothetical predicted protein [Pelobates cultripes]|uniref:Uncharacterized protein n=1 Tax=Pelobates cultripes TaxID=61616 RepID=A0AAD1TEY8_PELCU|nr:Hypothetical predicted protein [Pelobates cultripes]